MTGIDLGVMAQADRGRQRKDARGLLHFGDGTVRARQGYGRGTRLRHVRRAREH
jgi:hypothetical protein